MTQEMTDDYQLNPNQIATAILNCSGDYFDLLQTMVINLNNDSEEIVFKWNDSVKHDLLIKSISIFYAIFSMLISRSIKDDNELNEYGEIVLGELIQKLKKSPLFDIIVANSEKLRIEMIKTNELIICDKMEPNVKELLASFGRIAQVKKYDWINVIHLKVQYIIYQTFGDVNQVSIVEFSHLWLVNMTHVGEILETFYEMDPIY